MPPATRRAYLSGNQWAKINQGYGTQPAPTPGPAPAAGGRGCRVPRSQLERITGAQASLRQDVSRCLISGRWTAPSGQVGEDFVAEASGRTDSLVSKAGEAPQYAHASFSGLQRDDAGQPLALWDVKKLVYTRVTATSCVMTWANDIVALTGGTVLTDCLLEGHADYVLANGTRQHPDGAQAEFVTGPIIVTGCEINNAALPAPTRTDGALVPVNSKISSSNSSIRLNDVSGKGNQTSGLYLTDTVMSGGTGFLLSVLPADSAQTWWIPRYDGNGQWIGGVHFTGNTSAFPRSNYSDYQGPRALYDTFKAQNIRLNEDGTTSPWYSKAPWIF